jgi:rhomboid protease GluP
LFFLFFFIFLDLAISTCHIVNQILFIRRIERLIMRISYNAPVTLTYALIASMVLTFDSILGTDIIPSFFMAPPRGYFSASDPLAYLRLFTHVAGHSSWTHLLGNFMLILLLGPILEEKYGGASLLLMILTTALVTGLLNALFFSTALMGASGIVFMMIILGSFARVRAGEIPITFILILLLYLAKEIVSMFQMNSVSEFAHIVGGICGSLFGSLRPKKS